jgi:hypothetical protein
MYNKETLTFTFHHYWRDFCPQLPMQPLPIITDVSMNLDQVDVYNIM